MVVRNRESGKGWPNPGKPDEYWRSFCREFERIFLETPSEQFWLKKFRRFEQKNKVSIPSLPQPKVRRVHSCVTGRLRSSKEIDQSLFQEECISKVEAEFAPPRGPIQVDLEELIKLTASKRMRSRLAERRIQVTGRSMEKFVAPKWKSLKQKQEERMQFTMEEQAEQMEKLQRNQIENKVKEQ
jgi:hypothetical protein